MEKRDGELRTIKALFIAILVILILAIGAAFWYVFSYGSRPQINNINYVSKEVPLNAYELAVKEGFKGSQSQWLASLKGTDGKDGETKIIKETVVKEVPVKAEDGKSAYELWLEIGNEGSVEDFLESLSPPVQSAKVFEVRFNEITQKYETKYSTDVFWKVVPSCGIVKSC